jgi:hypothetical protein
LALSNERCREGFNDSTGFLARVIREACLRLQGDLETVVEFLPRLRRPGLSRVDHWLRPKSARMAPFITGPDKQAVHIRSTLAQKRMTGRMWKYHTRDRSTSTEIHFGPAVAVVLFNDYANMEPPKCYLFPKAIERVDPFLPVLKDLAESGTFLLAAMVLLNLLEVALRTTHLPQIVEAVQILGPRNETMASTLSVTGAWHPKNRERKTARAIAT